MIKWLGSVVVVALVFVVVVVVCLLVAVAVEGCADSVLVIECEVR